MLFPYKFIDNHSIYTLQKWMDELFIDVWCKADPSVDYDIELLPKDLKEITLDIYNDAKVKNDYLYGPIERVYKIFQKYDQTTKNLLEQAYTQNNLIKDLCKNTNGCNPFTYSTLFKLNKELCTELELFYKNLFNNVIKLECVREKIGNLDSHYDEFVTINDEGKCPFCGLSDIKSQYLSKRDAYDHFLPKDIYPFNSINFYNLAPMCYNCNSSYKLKADPLHKRDHITRRRAFYPFDTKIEHNIQLTISLNSKDILSLTPNDIKLEIKSIDHEEEIESWKEVFGIEERYKEKCLKKNEGKYWFEQAVEEYKNVQIELGVDFTKEKWVQYLINAANRKPHADGNHIKAEFLEACRRIGAL